MVLYYYIWWKGGRLLKYYLAIDIGASSGRHIVGWKDGGVIETKEVYRFPNGMTKKDGSLVWDVDALFEQVVEGIKAAFSLYPEIESLSIDTWGVDYVLLCGGKEILPVFAYRDDRTEEVIPLVHEIVPFAELYSRTGCQFSTFNSIYQLYADKISGRLEKADDMLMIPEYLMWKLCGVKAKEYTNATTTGLINAKTHEFDGEIIDRLGLSKKLFPKPTHPKTVLGNLLPEIAEKVGGDCKVLLCATHDTGSAVEGIEMEGNHPYISSGTWSLLGVKTKEPITDEKSQAANYSNEGGVGYNRYQKNIMGLWIVSELKKELCPDATFEEIERMADSSSFDTLIDANDKALFSPDSMKAEFDRLAGGFESACDYFRCAYRSLALAYKKALDELEQNVGESFEKLYIVGGGAKNKFLNRMTAEFTGKQVVALPIEATSLGNLKIQMETE